jgi:uncharacterized protein YjbI with pentapeptide repeats
LHSERLDKSAEAFAKGLAIHEATHGYDFRNVVFPSQFDRVHFDFATPVRFEDAVFLSDANFLSAIFEADVSFKGATFCRDARFGGAVFCKNVSFKYAKFLPREESAFTQANFSEVLFHGTADFTNGTFDAANFDDARFDGVVQFRGAQFGAAASFCDAQFSTGVDFAWATFGGRADFRSCRFDDLSVFSGAATKPIFAGVDVNLSSLRVRPDVLIFREADFTQCHLLDTDVRGVELTAILWPKLRTRFCVFDEIAPPGSGYYEAASAERTERLYRELKQNYEDHHDYERAGDFHYGEKHMRRRSADTPRSFESMVDYLLVGQRLR